MTTTPAAVQQAIAALAKDLGVTAGQISVVRVTEEEWPDSSLGCPKPGQAYLQVITPGYRVVLGANGKEYEYHTDMASQVIACGR